jgi:nitrate reductase NapA
MSELTRREFVKRAAYSAATVAAMAMLPGVSFGAWNEQDADLSDVQWRKTPCRFCGTGCGLLVGLSKGRAVAVKGDPDAAVNRGLACVKGYHSVQALYGKDRLTQAMVRRDGKMVPVPIGEALDLVAEKLKGCIAEHGKDSVSIYGSGQWTIPDGYVASKLFKGSPRSATGERVLPWPATSARICCGTSRKASPRRTRSCASTESAGCQAPFASRSRTAMSRCRVS